jgi:hypothetical protein
MPTIKFYKGGKEVTEVVGANLDKIRAAVTGNK